MSASAVFTNNLRVTFVDGQETYAPDPGFVACGAGTGFPAEATLDQIAEIYYRVKDAWFYGAFSWAYDTGDGPSTLTFSAPSSMPSNRTLEDGSPISIQTRGYSMPGPDDYNNAEYDAGLGDMYSDIGDNERGMWRERWNSDIVSDFGYQYITHTCVTAFTYSSEFPGPPDNQWWGYGEDGGGVTCRMGRRVAVVKTDPANGFFDPTNKFFIEFEFAWSSLNSLSPMDSRFTGGTNINDGVYGDISASVSLAGNYTIRIHTGDIFVPIYQVTDTTISDPSCSVIHEAIEWWPYARLANPHQIWDSATGEFIPIGAPFAAFDLDNSDLVPPLF